MNEEPPVTNESQQENLPHLEYFGVDKDRINRGTEEIKKVWEGLNFGERQKLSSEDWLSYSDSICAVFLGIKPYTAVKITPEISDCIKKLQSGGELSDDYVVTDNAFYSKQKVRETINNNRQIFGLEEAEEIDVDMVINKSFNPRHDATTNEVVSTGVLLGYPVEASKSYSEYSAYLHKFFDYALNHKDDNQVFKYYTFAERQSRLDANIWKDSNEDYISQTIDRIDEFNNIPEEAKRYIIHSRSVHTRGFDFVAESTSDYYKDFKNFSYNATLVFHDAKINDIYKSHLHQ